MENCLNLGICELKECNLYLHDPITLPCGNTICKEHVASGDIPKCYFCREEHKVPHDGFRINKILNTFINCNAHLNGSHKEAKLKYDKMLLDLEECAKLKPDAYIFEYFDNIRNKIDTHRRELIDDINKRSNKIISLLNDLEKDCQLNSNETNKFDLKQDYEKEINSVRRKLRVPKINLDEANSLIQRIDKSIKEIAYKLSAHKNDLLMNKSIEFVERDDRVFGSLFIDIPLIKTGVELVPEPKLETIIEEKEKEEKENVAEKEEKSHDDANENKPYYIPYPGTMRIREHKTVRFHIETKTKN